MELIDRDAFYDEYSMPCKRYGECDSYKDCIECAFAHIPAVDAVEVVRCKDCKHRGTESCYLYVYDAGYNEFGEDYAYEEDRTKDDFFCAEGERKEVQE